MRVGDVLDSVGGEAAQARFYFTFFIYFYFTIFTRRVGDVLDSAEGQHCWGIN